MRRLWRTRSNPLAWWWALLTLASGGNIALWFLLYGQLRAAAGQQPGQRARHLGHALPLRSLCFWLRLQILSPARGCSAHLLVRYMAIERRHRPIRGDRSRGLLRSAVGHRPAPARPHRGSGHHREPGMDDRAADRRGAVLLMVWRVDDQLLWPMPSRTRYGPLPSSWLVLPFAGCCRSSMAWFAQVSSSPSSGLQPIWLFLIAIDVPMYLNRWREGLAAGGKVLSPLAGRRDASTRWVVTHDFAQWKDEIAWMSLYFTAAVWASLALCLIYSLGDHLPRYRAEPATHVLGFVGKKPAPIEIRQGDRAL